MHIAARHLHLVQYVLAAPELVSGIPDVPDPLG
jgi:hypothetical protein